MADQPHRTRVVLQRAYREWRAQCECGWTGSYFHTEASADEEARRHIVDEQTR